MEKANSNIRKQIMINGLKYWQVAEEIGVSPGTFTVWLRTELDDQRKIAVMDAIEKLNNSRKGDGINGKATT